MGKFGESESLEDVNKSTIAIETERLKASLEEKQVQILKNRAAILDMFLQIQSMRTRLGLSVY